MVARSESVEELLSRLAAGAGITLIGSGIGKVLFYGYNVILARLLGPETYGVYFLSYVIVFNLTDLVAIINSNTTVRYAGVYFDADDRRRLSALTALSILAIAVVGLLAALVLILAAPWLAETVFDMPELEVSLRYFALSAPLLAIYRLTSSTLVAMRRITERVLEFDILMPFLLILMLPLLIGSDGAQLDIASLSYTVSVGIGTLVTILSLWRAGALPGNPRLLELRKITKYSVTVYGMSNLNNLIRWADVWIVGLFLDAEASGLYGVAIQIGMIITLWSRSFNSVFGPTSATLFEQRQIDTLYKTYKMSTKWSIILSLPILLLVIVAGDTILELFYGSAYESLYWVAIIIVLGNIIHAGTNGSSTILTTNDYETRELINVAVGGFGTLLINVLLIPWLGIIGAAGAKTASLTFVQGLRLATLRQIFEARHDALRFAKPIIAFLISLGFSYLIRLAVFANFAEIEMLLSITIVALGVYSLALHLLGWEPDDKEVAGHLFKAVARKR